VRTRDDRGFRPALDRLEEYCLLSQMTLPALGHIAEHAAEVSHARALAAPTHPTKATATANQVHALTTYTFGPVNVSGTYRSRYDNHLRFFYSPLSSFNISTADSVARSLASRPESGTLTHRLGDYFARLSPNGGSFVFGWNNITGRTYDWVAVKYLGSNRFATLVRSGQSYTLNDGQNVQYDWSTGGSRISLVSKNLTGSSFFYNDVGYSFYLSNY
jgi:hypothetical protein